MSRKKTKEKDENKQKVEFAKQNKWQQKQETKETTNPNQNTKDDTQNCLVVVVYFCSSSFISLFCWCVDALESKPAKLHPASQK